MSSIDASCPAFPVDEKNWDGTRYYGHLGMTLRDYFAAKALAGMCANPGGPFQANDRSGWGFVNCTADDVAATAYHMADAMLKARSA